jgi:hypothetical protein
MEEYENETFDLEELEKELEELEKESEDESEDESEVDSEELEMRRNEMEPYGKHRFFTAEYKLTDGSVVYAGRYAGEKPRQAATKALSFVFRSIGKSDEPVKLLLTECTRGSEKKIILMRVNGNSQFIQYR